MDKYLSLPAALAVKQPQNWSGQRLPSAIATTRTAVEAEGHPRAAGRRRLAVAEYLQEEAV